MSEPYSAKDGKLWLAGNLQTDVRNINFQRSNSVKKYASSSTGGFHKTLQGIGDWSVNFEIFLPDGAPAFADFEVGDLVALEGVTTAGHNFSGNVRIATIGEPVPIESGDGLVASVSAEGDGAYSLT